MHCRRHRPHRRRAAPQVQPIADINNYLLPIWMIVLGASILGFQPAADRRAGPGYPGCTSQSN